MGFFNIFKKKDTPNIMEKYNLKHQLTKLYEEIQENIYVNDLRTKKLFDHALELTKNDIVERHFVYNQLIDYYFSLRDKEKNALEKCVEYCKEDIKIAPEVLKKMKNDNMWKHHNEKGELEFVPPQFPSFKRLAIIYENNKNYQEAIEICEKALKLNLRDGTKTGFEGRIKRLERKLNI